MAYDPGVHVSDACATSGKIINKIVSNADFSIHLKWSISPAKENNKSYGNWRLVLYSNTDMHPFMLTTVDVPGTPNAKMQVRMPIRHNQNIHTLFVRLFAEVLDPSDKVWAQELIASGCVRRNTMHGIRLEDIERQTVAMIDVIGFPFDETTPKTHGINAEAQKLIRTVESAQFKLSNYVSSTDNFTSVDVHLDRVTTLPLIWFAFHATRMRANPQQAIAYFEHILSIAKKLAIPKASEHQLLADMLSLPSLAWVYRDDTNSRGKESEHWTSLWSYPTGATNAFDCEDGAKALLELFHVFISLEIDEETSAYLYRMQRIARKYKAFLAIGELYSEDGSARRHSDKKHHTQRTAKDFVMHCYCILLPKDASADPVLVLESSSYGSAAYDPKAKNQLDDKGLVASQKAKIKAFPEKDRSLACVRFPPAEMLEDRSYGALVALLLSDPVGGTTAHYLMNRVDTFDFILDTQRKLPPPAYSMTYAQTEKLFANELALIPGSRFPSPPATPFTGSVPQNPLLFPHCPRAKWTEKARLLLPLSLDSSLCVF